MPGQKSKKNARRFLEALLIYTSPSTQGVYEERFKINFDWKESTGRFYRLVVRTTLKELERLVPSDLTDGKLSRFQIREVLWEGLRDFLEILEDNREKTQGVQNLHFTLRLWSKDKEENLLQFDQEWERRLPKSPSPNSRNQPKGDIDWQQLCRQYLQLQRPLASNLFSDDMGISFDLDDLDKLHVPLGLVERQQKSQRWEDFDPEWGSRVYQEEKSIPIDYDDFFDRVLAQGQSPKSEGSRLAIIGEPGAGKTFLLLKVREWVLNQAQALPIWISLGEVGNKPLLQYLTEDWLPEVLELLEPAPEEAVSQLKQLLKKGSVWLLLDGADEMSVPNPLRTLAKQLRVPLLQNVRVVLTCRVNLWDAISNALDEFDTYKMLDFSFGDGNKPNQVKLFIDNWFSSSNSSNGLRLWQQLNQTGMTRIKDLARNPLRLALLCLIWARKQERVHPKFARTDFKQVSNAHSTLTSGNTFAKSGCTQQETLPKTKAQLYESFVKALYHLKQKVFPTTLRERTDLNAALGKLALQALILGYKSVLPTALVEKELNQGELFEKALELGWLNRVGVEPQNIFNSVYAFFHPTFLEYFAASAIGDNWHLFLHHIQENPLDPSACYRIFEPQWQEVFLLWLGREDVAPSSKKALLQALIKFEDGCLGLYKFRAYLLAAAGIAEFSSLSESQVADQIVSNLSKWAFSEFYGSKIEVFNVEQPQLFNVLQIQIAQRSLDTLYKTDRSRAITQLLQLQNQTDNVELREFVAEILADIDYALELAPCCPEKIRVDEAKVSSELGELPFTNGNQAITTAQDQVIGSTEPETQREKSQDMISKELIDQLIEKLEAIKDEQLLWEPLKRLRKIAFGYPEVILALRRLLLKVQSDNVQGLICQILLEMSPGDFEVISDVIKSLRRQNTSDYLFLLRYLQLEHLPEVVKRLKDCLTESGYRSAFYRYQSCAFIIWHCAQNMPYPDFYQAWHSDTFSTHNELL